MIELAITVKNNETTLTQKHLIYDDAITISHDDATLAKLVKKAQDDFGDDAEEVLLKFKYEW